MELMTLYFPHIIHSILHFGFKFANLDFTLHKQILFLEPRQVSVLFTFSIIHVSSQVDTNLIKDIML